MISPFRVGLYVMVDAEIVPVGASVRTQFINFPKGIDVMRSLMIDSSL